MNLQEKVNAASSDAVIQHDEEFVGNLTVNKPLTIQGTGKIRTPNADPAIYIPPRTGPVKLRIPEVLTTVGWAQVHDIIRFGTRGPEQTTLQDVPQGLDIDGCDIHGQPEQIIQRGISANGANLRVTKTKIHEIHADFDTQSICSWNGPGPFFVEDCFLEATGENIMFGGAQSSIPNLVPSDIIIRNSHFFKPLSWKGRWPIKNHFEIKNGKKVVVDNCTFENCWVSAQDGYAWLFTVRGEGGGKNPWNTIEDVTMQNCTVKNVHRGILTQGLDNLDTSQQARGLRILNCKFDDIKNWFFVLNGYHDVTIDHCTHFQGHNIMVLHGRKSERFKYLNSVTERNPDAWGIKADGGGEGTDAFNLFCTDWEMKGNVVAGAPSNIYPPGNFFPADLSGLANSKGTDGKIPGVGILLPPPPPPPVIDPPPPPPPPPPVATTPVYIYESRKFPSSAPERLKLMNEMGAQGFRYVDSLSTTAFFEKQK
jgi:hypothetical protein